MFLHVLNPDATTHSAQAKVELGPTAFWALRSAGTYFRMSWVSSPASGEADRTLKPKFRLIAKKLELCGQYVKAGASTYVALNILSIQSSVAYGHVGNSAAVFPLQRLGVEVWSVNTVHFSNHTGYGSWRGPVFPAEAVSDIIRGIEERGVLPLCDGVLSGYLGDASLGQVIVEAFYRVKAANPRATYCCDPVMGDVGRGFFVRPGIPEFMRQIAIPAATIVTPNQFELEFLAGGSVSDLGSVLEAIANVRALGPEIVLVTSLRRSDAPAGQIEVLAVDQSGAYAIATPLLPLNVNGAGDTAAALFFAHWLLTGSTREALQLSVNAVFALLEATVAAGAREIQLIAAQDAIASPPQRFTARRVETV